MKTRLLFLIVLALLLPGCAPTLGAAQPTPAPTHPPAASPSAAPRASPTAPPQPAPTREPDQAGSEMKHDQSADFLKPPDGVYPADHPDFDIAKEAPAIDFGLVELQPRFGQPYGVWGEAMLGPDGGYYFAVGNHKGTGGADAFLIRYDPVLGKNEILLSSRQVCGWKESDYGDGKLHGIPDIAPNGDLWLLTFYGPTPNKSDWGKTYMGGWLIKYNIYSKTAECLGRPVEDESWPVHTWDWHRSRLYAVGEYGLFQDPTSGDKPAKYPSPAYDWGKILVYDTENRKVIRGQDVPANAQGNVLHWNRRSLLLDRETGRLYGTEADAPFRLLMYDPEKDAFFKMESRLDAPLYSWPTTKNADGSFFLFDQKGGFYRFYPEQDRVERLGKNWLDGTWTENMRLSPGGRYLYYVSESAMGGWKYGLPLIQYDAVTNRKKVIAFLETYYRKKYQFAFCCTYGIALSQDGSSVFIAMNGNYFEPAYEYVAVLEVHIPEAERTDDRVTP